MTIAPVESGTAVATLHATPDTDLETWARKLVAASQLGEALARTSFVPATFRGKPEECTAAIMYGDEIGLSPMAALQQVFVIGGKPSLYARAMHALVLAHGHEVVIESRTDEAVTVRGRRRGATDWHTETWTVQRAHRAGYTNNAKYNSDPQAMLTARALADVCRIVAPDVLAGVAYTVEELEVGVVDGVAPESPPLADVAPQSGAERARSALAAARATKPPQDGAGTPEAPADPADAVPMADPAPESPAVRVLDRTEYRTQRGPKHEEPPATQAPPPADHPMTDPDPDAPRPINDAQRRAMFSAFRVVMSSDARTDDGRTERLAYIAGAIGRPVESTNDLTMREAGVVLDKLQADALAIAEASTDAAGGDEA